MPNFNRFMLTLFPIICICVLLNACNQTTLNAPQSFFKNNLKAQITRESITKLPYASLAAKIHSKTPSLIILGQVLNDQLFWYSSEKEVLVTRYGQITRTYGLKHNLWGLRVNHEDIFKTGLHTLKEPRQITFEIDLNRKAKQNLSAIATYSIVKPETITIYEMTYDTLKISEKVHVKDINWHYENFYWIDSKTGFIWKSIQHIHPKLDPIHIDVLKRIAP